MLSARTSQSQSRRGSGPSLLCVVCYVFAMCGQRGKYRSGDRDREEEKDRESNSPLLHISLLACNHV